MGYQREGGTYAEYEYVRQKAATNAHVRANPVNPVPTRTAADHEQFDDHQRLLSERQAGCAHPAYLAARSKWGDLFDHGIPEFRAVSSALQDLGGWSVVPATGIDPRFFEHLANRRFPMTMYLRHIGGGQGFSDEPDLLHELFGHIVFLADERIRSFYENVGAAYIAAHEAGRKRIESLNWFTTEVGDRCG